MAVSVIMTPSTAHAKTWGACGESAPNTKLVREFDHVRGDAGDGHVLPSGTATLVCGSVASNYGYRYIVDKHVKQWEQDSFLTNRNWRDHTDWAIAAVLADPDKVTYKATKDTYTFCRQITLRDTRTGRVVGHKYPRVGIGARTKNLLTAFPASRRC